ncbi:hypothetical protein EV356DRAFT_154508 [Viridothelium virens]|uniref:C2H2-type domain-containing protein n=1 Tax=Viridothelium virens TaxID=1048519 RepID=A0A6A6H9K1_VIRVR|nr:hypothetical protein EV356DRAFT_154508 [Viridothelium virens]
MAMAVDNRQQASMGTMGYDPLRYPPGPQFTNPWASQTSAPSSSSQLYPSTLAAGRSSGLESSPQQTIPRSSAVSSMPYATSIPVTSAPIGTGISLPPDALYGQQNLLDVPQEVLNPGRSYPGEVSAAETTTAATYAPTSAPQYAMDYAPTRTAYDYTQDAVRRGSHPLSQPQARSTFSDALDASRGMVAMSQDITPRNIYGNAGNRNSTDSYGFPATHSAHSSISSASYNPSYYQGSVGDSSVTDYSSASESVGDMGSRTLPRPTALLGPNLPPAPQSMMGQFSSKVSSSSQKKHKCKICDKRFTRPSSLQTHMYSHTGEKPFACDVEGCGRHFSVVSNLRRHRKVHKGDRDHPSPEED